MIFRFGTTPSESRPPDWPSHFYSKLLWRGAKENGNKQRYLGRGDDLVTASRPFTLRPRASGHCAGLSLVRGTRCRGLLTASSVLTWRWLLDAFSLARAIFAKSGFPLHPLRPSL